ncbi:hypothetical protein [Candidatus Lokiarchaeum ossiferum]|uniref:hypothetical protein n=1 Tax=Candidatus Lokiarchaeum ossiferum TaxID=2951803 RepID=UPI00352F3DD4
MARALYTDLFLKFTPAASGNGITQTAITNLIKNLYREAANALEISYTESENAYLDDERVKGIVIKRCSKICNDWNIKSPDGSQISPDFGLTKEDKQDILNLKTMSFGFASYEDTPLNEIGDGN